MATSSAERIEDLSPRERRRVVVWAAVRTITALALVVAIYFLTPLGHRTNARRVVELGAGLLAFVVVLAWQLRQIARSAHPSVRAVEALAFSVPVYILLFATAYFLMAQSNAAAFGGGMTRTDSMYFSTTIFTTVGFGDITAKTQAARVLVTLQMFLDLVILGLVARLVVNAVRLGKLRRVE